MVAGLTVGLTVIPQAIAYANVAGLPLQVNQLNNKSEIQRKFSILPNRIEIWKKKIIHMNVAKKIFFSQLIKPKNY